MEGLDVVLADCEAVARPRPVAEHDRDCTHNLYLRTVSSILFNPDFWCPTVLPNLPKKLAAPHHLGKSLLVMLKVDKIPISKTLTPIGHFLWQNMRMAVYL